MLEKLINEHGSSTILRERLELISDKYSMLEEKNAHLKEQNEEFESQLEDAKKEIAHLQEIVNEDEKSKSLGSLGSIELQILHLLFEKNDEFRIEYIAHNIGSDDNTAKYHINNLLEDELIYDILSMGGQTTYKISDKGIRFIVESKKTHNQSLQPLLLEVG